MSKALSKTHPELHDDRADERAQSWKTMAVLIFSGFLGLGGGLLGADLRDDVSWQVVAINVAAVAVGVMLAVVLLRIVEVLSLRQAIGREIRTFHERSARIRARFEDAYPGVSARAHDIDPGRLLDEALADFARRRR